MEWFNLILVALFGLLLRLAIPLAITLLAVYILHKVDVRWQEEAAQVPPAVVVQKVPCWDIKNCPAEQRANCPSPTSVEPCWQAQRLSNGYLREECINCQVFYQAPIPTPVHP
jgi:hypothetical protein